MTVKEISQKTNVPEWKIYYIREKLNLDRNPTVEEVEQYRGKVGRPKKGERRSVYLMRGTINDVLLQLELLKKHYGGGATVKYIIEKECEYEAGNSN